MYLHQLATAIHAERQKRIADHARDRHLADEAKAAKRARERVQVARSAPPTDAPCGSAQSVRSGPIAP